MSGSNSKHIGFRWLDNKEQKGEMLFTFDGKRVFNLFRDYPDKLTIEQKKEFDSANPFWANFFKDRFD